MGACLFRPVSLIPFTKALVRIKEKENLDYENLIRKFPSSVFGFKMIFGKNNMG